MLSGLIEHVRIGHVLPPHSEILEGVFRRGLADRGMPLDIGEGSFYPNLPWMRRREEKDFIRPRLFLPYFEEAKVNFIFLCAVMFFRVTVPIQSCEDFALIWHVYFDMINQTGQCNW